jgi:hypothetical protein
MISLFLRCAAISVLALWAVLVAYGWCTGKDLIEMVGRVVLWPLLALVLWRQAGCEDRAGGSFRREPPPGS